MAPVGSIVAAVDFSPDSVKSARRAAQLAAMLEAPLTLMHVLEGGLLSRLTHLVQAGTAGTPARQAAAGLEKLAAESRQQFGCTINCQVHEGDPSALIAAAAAGHHLLAVGAHGHHRLRELAVGTTAQRLVRRVVEPTLVVHGDVTGPYRRVLVATDFSVHAQAALRLALALAPDAELHVLHAVRPWLETEMVWAGVDRNTIAHYRDQALQEAERDMQVFLAASTPRVDRVTPHIEHAYAPVALKRIAAQLDADLLVVGKHGKTLTEELLLGSVTQHVLAEAPCDVLVASAAARPAAG